MSLPLARRHFVISALALSFAGAISVARTRAAFAGESAQDYIRKMGSRALAVLSAETPHAERVERMSALFEEGLDFKTISRFALGQHWNAATPEQRTAYEASFAKVVTGTYARIWAQETAKDFKIIGQQVLGERDTLVNTEVLREGGKPTLRFGWRVRETQNGFRIVDLMVDGISMLITQRDDFNSAVRQKGLDGLIAHLQQREAQL